MRRVSRRFLYMFLSLLLVNSVAFALSNEYKNSLVKVELVKSTDNSYNVELYTQTKFQDPVKVIKKSDLNYYILLPETKNSVTKTSANGTDIRNIISKEYPYAGSDVKNGYTKININTTKPIDFKINVKNVQTAVKTPEPTKTAEIQTTKPSNLVQKQESKVQKKNSDFQFSKEKLEASKVKLQNKVFKQTQTKQKTVVQQEKKTFKKQEQKEVKNNKPLITEIEKAVMEDVQKAKEFQDLVDQQEIMYDGEEVIEAPQATELQEEIPQEELEQIEQIATDGHKKTDLLTTLIKVKNYLSKKVNRYGIGLKDLTLMMLVGILSFIIILFLLTRKGNQSAKIRRKLEFADDSYENIVNKQKNDTRQTEIKNDGQFFVFDKNVKQTGFCDPATSAIKRNYELSSYEPELKEDYHRVEVAPYVGKSKEQKKSDYDIIQKILKEENIIEIPTEVEPIETTQTVPIVAPIQEHKEIKPKEIVKKEPIIQEQAIEPTVLSSVEIAPERGFMCVSYNDNINLMGYIFDDVFLIHNFRQTKLENYEIQYRLVEKDDSIARFIVRIADSKMMIKSSKNSMKLEGLL